MSHKYQEYEEQPNIWQKIVSGFMNNVAGNAIESIKHQIRSVFKEIGKKTFAGLVLLTGTIFLLIAAVILLNELIDESSSIGFAIVGLVAVVIGLLMGRGKE